MLYLLDRNDGETAHYYVRRVLLYNIVNLILQPGDRIRETELCEQLKVSRTPVREGILDLVQYRLIELYPQSGTYVSKIDPEYVDSARYLRRLLEADLARTACTRASLVQVAMLKENLCQQKLLSGRANNEKEFLKLDNEFHHIIYEICGRHALIERLADLCAHFDRARVLSYRKGVSPKLVQDHEDVARAIENHDEMAAYQAAYAHLNREEEDEPGLREQYPNYYRD